VNRRLLRVKRSFDVRERYGIARSNSARAQIAKGGEARFTCKRLRVGRLRNLNGYSRDVSRGGRHGRQAARGDRSEALGAVHVRVWAKDEDCDEKRSPTRSCNGSAFSIYSWPHAPRREGAKQIQTSSPYSGYLPRAWRRDGSRMPSIPKRFSQSKETSLVRT
jgi:hypothetical protein